MIRFALILAILTLAGCASNENSLSPESQQLIEQLEETGASPEVQEYFSTLAEVIDAYVGMIEDMAETSKTAQDDGFAGAMSMIGNVASGMAEMAPLLERMDELEKQGEVLQEDMSPEEIEAFMLTYASMMKRFMEASERINP